MITKGFIAGILGMAVLWVAVVWGVMAYMDSGTHAPDSVVQAGS
ncbi:MAG: hypothetical protein ACOH2R_08655 [Pseudomonas sp.]